MNPEKLLTRSAQFPHFLPHIEQRKVEETPNQTERGEQISELWVPGCMALGTCPNHLERRVCWCAVRTHIHFHRIFSLLSMMIHGKFRAKLKLAFPNSKLSFLPPMCTCGIDSLTERCVSLNIGGSKSWASSVTLSCPWMPWNTVLATFWSQGHPRSASAPL